MPYEWITDRRGNQKYVRTDTDLVVERISEDKPAAAKPKAKRPSALRKRAPAKPKASE